MRRVLMRGVRQPAAVVLLALGCGAGALAQQPAPREATASDEAPGESVELRRAQTEPLRYPLPAIDPNQVPEPGRLVPRTSLPVPDRWRIMESLGQKDHWWDPYNTNTLKGDKPYEKFSRWGPDWFLNLGAVSDTLLEGRRLPIPVGAQSSQRTGSNSVFGGTSQLALIETVILSASVIKGNTTFKPPDYEFKFAGAFNINHTRVEEVRALNINPQKGVVRTDSHFGVQEAFADVHLRNVSDRYDFESVRVGIQPFISDFRGFVYNDLPFGVRLFGNRDNNQWQYNLGWFRRLEKDTNSGLNDIFRSWRSDDVFVANAFRQDWPVPGHTTQATLIYNRNREGDQSAYYDRNGFKVRPAVVGDVRPHNYDVVYAGVSGDGHFERWNLSTSGYLALGRASYDPIAQRSQSILAGFAAAELSRDFDWLRVRATGLIASADNDPFDGRSTGFDAILENPQIAGADTSFWIRQAIPLVGGGGVALSGRNGILPSLRSSKDQGQSNFVNPGLLVLGIGADADIAPQWRLIGNVSWLSFGNTSVLEYLRNQGNISRFIGTDISAAVQYRPYMTQNIVFNASVAFLQPGQAYRQLFPAAKRPYSVLANLLLTF